MHRVRLATLLLFVCTDTLELVGLCTLFYNVWIVTQTPKTTSKIGAQAKVYLLTCTLRHLTRHS